MNPYLIPIALFVSLGILVPFGLFRMARRQAVESNSARWKAFAERLRLQFKDRGETSTNTNAETTYNSRLSNSWIISGSIDGISIYLSQVYGSQSKSQLGITMELMYSKALSLELYIVSRSADLEPEDLEELELEKLEVNNSALESAALLFGKPKEAAEKWISSSHRGARILELLKEHPALCLTEEGADEFIAGDFGRASIESGDLKDEEWLERKIRSIASILRLMSQ